MLNLVHLLDGSFLFIITGTFSIIIIAWLGFYQIPKRDQQIKDFCNKFIKNRGKHITKNY